MLFMCLPPASRLTIKNIRSAVPIVVVVVSVVGARHIPPRTSRNFTVLLFIQIRASMKILWRLGVSEKMGGGDDS